MIPYDISRDGWAEGMQWDMTDISPNGWTLDVGGVIPFYDAQLYETIPGVMTDAIKWKW
jgi:hypothetical protein